MIITRSIALALICACANALSPNVPLHVVGDNSDCALYLNGPGRTSAYDYSINLLKGNFGYEGQTNCITYEAVNQAYLEARNRILVAQPKGDWKAEDFASVGELILDISINLARRYGLTYEEIEKGLPLIDTSRTLIREVCPPVFSHVECRAGKYRRMDGLCNNLQHPTWGATMAPFQRLIGPLFADGINAPRIAHHGRDLPLSRVVSRTMHPDDGFHDHAGTVMVIAWGQFMDHDYTLTATPLDPINRNDPEECCKRPPHLKHPYCNEIRIPDDDYFYRLFGVKCIDFVRGFPSPRPGCRLGSRNPFNTLTGTIDGNTVYGVTEKFARKLRTGFGGLLRMNPVFKEYGLKDLLPLKLDIPDEGCTRPNKNMYCFEAGEIRVNEQLVLTVMHTLMAREHNRVANALAEVNPHWDDETLFQEARRINIAEIQHITYNEFLPILLGKDVMEKFGLVLEKEGYWDGYDPEVNPDVIASFAAAAYRFGHSLLPTAVERWSKAHKFIASKRLSDLIRRPYDLYRAGVLDEYVMGLMNQVAQAMDDSITQEVTNHLFKKVGARFGMDLVSFNMQRGREFGLPGYMEFRKFCGLPPADTFQDLFGSMPNETVRKYETIFDHPIDVDLWSGGVSERPLPGSMLGPTFACIIATQFSYSKRGDRFWFELPNQPSSFTPEQLAEIRKSRLARVICDNTDIIDTVQLYPMVLPDHELNPRVPCRSGILPQMDFSKWAEPVPFHGPAKQFMTNATIIETNATKQEELIKDGKDCNKTEIIETITPNPDMVLLQAQNTNDTGTETTTEKQLDDITNKRPVNQTDPTDKDTVLKYVYKKGDKAVLDKKNNGHFRNSLKRRKRAAEDPLSPLPSKFQDSALIVNYETSHAPTASASWPSPNAPKTIKDAHLADFKIETRHDEIPSTKTTEVSNPNENTDKDENKQKDNWERSVNNNEKGERKDYIEKQSYPAGNSNSEESAENNAKYSNEKDVSNDSSEKYENRKDRDRSAESSENESNDYLDKKKPYKGTEKYSHINKPYESQHRSNPEESKENLNRQNRDSSEESSRESSNSRYNAPVNNKKNYREESSESSKENSNKKPRQTFGQDSRSYERDDRENSNEKFRTEETSEENYRPRERYEQDSRSYEHNDREKNRKPFRSEESSKENSNESPRERYEQDSKSYERDDRVKSNENFRTEETSQENRDDRPRERYELDSRSYEHDDRETNRKPFRSEESSKENSNDRSRERYEQDSRSHEQDDREKTKNIFLGEESSKEHSDERRREKYEQDSRSYERNNREKSKENTVRDFHSEESSKENENEQYEKNQNQSHKNPAQSNNKSSLPLQDIDLGDFSYERINLNENGKVITAKDNIELADPNSAVELLRSNETKPVVDNHDILQLVKNIHTPLNSNKLVSINDGEVRPVVELNAESDEDTSDENNSDKKFGSLDLKLSPVLENNYYNHKVANNEAQSGDVKQQFERIPLNYKHDPSIQEKRVASETNNPEEKETPATESEGTVDVFTPDDIKYDDKLKFKFDDLHITLPEIRLPEDILAFTRSHSPFKQEDDEKKNKKSHHRYDNDYYRKSKNSGDDENNNDDDDDDDRGRQSYYRYYGRDDKRNQDYRKKNADDDDNNEKESVEEDEDLYEKFVRERFGKRSSFDKRSEKLQAQPLNPELTKTLQNILKKTAIIDEQAKKSGDPNAGYAWTLEYGENL